MFHSRNIVMFKSLNIRYSLFLLFFSVLTVLSAKADVDGRWVRHTSAALRSASKESQIDRIIEGQRYVYFSVRGLYYTRGTNTTITYLQKFDPLQIFRYDKTLPWNSENIRPLAQEFELSGVMPMAMNYSPGAGVFVLIYENNSIDLIFDDGTFKTSHALLDVNVPGGLTPHSVTFDDERNTAYIAGSFGYLTLDLKSGLATDYHLLDKPVAWAGRVGDNMVIFAGSVAYNTYATSTYVYPVGQLPATLSNPVANLDNLQYLMPLSDDSFAALARGSADTSNVLTLYTVSDGKLTSKALTGTLTVDNGSTANLRHLFRTDGYASPTADGFAVYCNAAIYFLHKGREGEDLLTTISKPSTLTAGEKASKCASFDGSRVFLYTYENPGNSTDYSPRGFYTYSLSDAGWTDKSDVMTPNAPTTMMGSYLAYDPDYGMIMRGYGARNNAYEPDVDRLCAFKAGQWTDLSFSAHNSKYHTPTQGAYFLDIDPIAPGIVWGTSMRSGLFRVNFNDYSSFLCVGSEKYTSYQNSYPGYYAVLPKSKALDMMAYTSSVAFDNDNTMWFSHNEWLTFNNDIEYYRDSYNSLYYLTAEERRLMLDDPTQCQGVLNNMKARMIKIPENASNNMPRTFALKHEKNRNLVITGAFTYFTNIMRMVILDHNGTPGDQTDDRLVQIFSLYDEEGSVLRYDRENYTYEDPETGDLWYLTDQGTYILDPQQLFDGNNVVRRPKVKGVSGESVYPLEFVNAISMAADLQGRKWIASDEGLYCLSKDADDLLAHLTVENSQIPSNNVYDVAVDGSDGSVWVATDRGVAQFFPEGSAVAVPEGSHLNLWPSTVTPDYRGYVTLSGADTVSRYGVYDRDGNLVRDLGMAEFSRLQWDLTDDDGLRVNPGRYSVKRQGYEESHPLIVM